MGNNGAVEPPNGAFSAAVAPPELPQTTSSGTALSSPKAMSGGQDFLKYQQDIGVRGPKQLSRQAVIEQLALGGSTAAEGVRQEDQVLVNTALCQLFSDHTRRLLADTAWCRAFAEAVSEPTAQPQPPAGKRRILVLGLGTGIPALAAARSGCEVVWAERVGRFAELCDALARANGMSASIRICRVQQYADLARLVKADGGRRFDLVVTEDGIGDDPFADGLLHLARLARRSLLAPSGRFVPSRLRVFAAVHSVRTTCIAGFDLRAFNAFRNHEAIWYDAEHAASEEGPKNSRCLSAALPLVEIDLNSTADMARYATAASGGSSSFSSSSARQQDRHQPTEHTLVIDAPGVLNACSYWFELGMPNGGQLRLGPPELRSAPGVVDGGGGHGTRSTSPRPAQVRAKRQQLRFLGYERTVAPGERVRLVVRVSDTHGLVIDCPLPDSDPVARWPRINLLAYHFHMIADEGRNGAFDRALVRAIRTFREEHGGRPPRVLDIGSGSGLLAMMAARAGASEVHSLEMVPSLAACAKHIVAANGLSSRVTIHSVMSTDLDPATVGGKFDLLVCEIVDDLLLGESVITTVADARRRLLAPQPTILPGGGSLWAMAVELLPSHDGLDLSPLHELSCATVISCNPNESIKLQHRREGSHYKRLSEPVELLCFDWAHASLEALGATAGESRRLPLRITRPGALTTLIVYLTLDLDGDPANTICTGPDSPNRAWDQCARHLPVPLRVEKGESLTLVARHTDCYLQTLEVSGFNPAQLASSHAPGCAVDGLRHLVRNPGARGLSVSLQ